MNDLFSTQATNFVSALETNTDPRTGQFMVNLPLVSFTGNAALGPELSLTLNYSPLVNSNFGFGKGFSLGISRFNNQNNTLELSNGETYRISPGSCIVRNKKLDTFHFSYTNGSNDASGYTLFWKEGKVEYLTYVGGGNYVMTRTESPLGHSITVKWNWNGQQVLPSEIRDDTTLLCRFAYKTSIVMTVWPETADEYETTFTLINGDQLIKVSRQVSLNESLVWLFGYTIPQGGDELLLTDITYPTGMTEQVTYTQIEGHRFPSSAGNHTRLPVVISHILTPGGKQPRTVKSYTYTAQNFLGFNGDFGNWDGNNDYIYTTLTDYTYGSTETVKSGTDTLITQRSYNNYHLQISELTRRGQCSYRTETTYYAKTGSFIDSQPAQFQLAKTFKETWTDSTGAQRSRFTETEFDTAGNPVYEKSPDGTETITTWYDAKGEDGCPAEPQGFVRFIKSSRVIPRDTSYPAPVLETRYRFSTLDKDTHIVQTQIDEYADNILLKRKKLTYMNVSSNIEYGRLLLETTTLYTKGESSEHYTSKLEYDTTISKGRLLTDSTFTGHDGLSFTTTQETSAFSGLLMREKDAMGVECQYTYDRTGRPLTRTLASGTPYEHTMSWAYSLEENCPVTEITDGFSNRVKILFDGSGRETGRKVFDKDTTQTWYQVSDSEFNAFGENISDSNHDWLTSSGEQYNVTISTTRDTWGNAASMKASDGSRALQVTDPVVLSQQVWMDEVSSINALKTGEQTTQLDIISELPIRTTRTYLDGSTLGYIRQEWDGIGRMCLEQDERGNITNQTYDAYGRLLTQTLADGTVLSKTYAPHLIDNIATSITITGKSSDGTMKTWLIGTQELDSLGRLTKTTNGGRTTRYIYKNADTEPATVITPAGDDIHYVRIPELGNALSSVQSDDVLQKFVYDASTGRMISAEEVNTSTSNKNEWYASGLLKKEEFIQNGTTHSAEYTYTLSGETASYTDITGNKTLYKRDDYGRVVQIDDAALTTTLKYDALGRKTEQVVKSKSGGETLTTKLEYDDFSRESVRTITDNTADGVVVAQTWLPGDLLESRIQKNLAGVLLRTETYSYDSRNRLIEYTVSGTLVVEDTYGNPIKKQIYHYDALNNLTSVITTLNDNTTDTELHHYSNASDPMQLTSVTHTHPAYPPVISLEYDANGCMTRDESGRQLEYDTQSRLKTVLGENINGGRYGYDALNRLVTQHVSTGDVRELFYRGDELVNEVTR